MSVRIATYAEYQRIIKGAPAANTEWQHVNGGGYRVAMMALYEPTLEPLVIYVSHETGIPWARPLSAWQEMVNNKGVWEPRFVQEK